MDDSQACAGQNQLIVFPAQTLGVHCLYGAMWVAKIHALKHEERDAGSLTCFWDNVSRHIRLEINPVLFGLHAVFSFQAESRQSPTYHRSISESERKKVPCASHCNRD